MATVRLESDARWRLPLTELPQMTDYRTDPAAALCLVASRSSFIRITIVKMQALDVKFCVQVYSLKCRQFIFSCGFSRSALHA